MLLYVAELSQQGLGMINIALSNNLQAIMALTDTLQSCRLQPRLLWVNHVLTLEFLNIHVVVAHVNKHEQSILNSMFLSQITRSITNIIKSWRQRTMTRMRRENIHSRLKSIACQLSLSKLTISLLTLLIMMTLQSLQAAQTIQTTKFKIFSVK